MGHPKADKDRRTEQLHVRVTPTDKATFVVAARKAKHGGDVSAWARVTLLHAAEALGVTPEEVEAALAQGEAEEGPQAAPPPAPKAKRPARPKS